MTCHRFVNEKTLEFCVYCSQNMINTYEEKFVVCTELHSVMGAIIGSGIQIIRWSFNVPEDVW